MRRVGLALLLLAAGSAHAFADDGDAAAGEKVFRKCQACHNAEEAKNKVGPTLHGVIGRTAGTVDGFKYSPAMKEAGEKGWVWTEENIDKYLADPKDTIPKNRMIFVGLKKDQDRADVIAYLKSVAK